jgi:hypothetical protein
MFEATQQQYNLHSTTFIQLPYTTDTQCCHHRQPSQPEYSAVSNLDDVTWCCYVVMMMVCVYVGMWCTCLRLLPTPIPFSMCNSIPSLSRMRRSHHVFDALWHRISLSSRSCSVQHGMQNAIQQQPLLRCIALCICLRSHRLLHHTLGVLVVLALTRPVTDQSDDLWTFALASAVAIQMPSLCVSDVQTADRRTIHIITGAVGASTPFSSRSVSIGDDGRRIRNDVVCRLRTGGRGRMMSDWSSIAGIDVLLVVDGRRNGDVLVRRRGGVGRVRW